MTTQEAKHFTHEGVTVPVLLVMVGETVPLSPDRVDETPVTIGANVDETSVYEASDEASLAAADEAS